MPPVIYFDFLSFVDGFTRQGDYPGAPGRCPSLRSPGRFSNHDFERSQFFGRATLAGPLARDAARGDANGRRGGSLVDRYRGARCLAACRNFSRRNARRMDCRRRRLGRRAARPAHGAPVSAKRRRAGGNRRAARILSSGGGAPGVRSRSHDRRASAPPPGNDLDARAVPALSRSRRHAELGRATARSPVPAIATGGRTRREAGAVDAPG